MRVMSRLFENSPNDVPPVIDKSYTTHNKDLRSISLKIHEYAEIGFKEYKSSSLLTDYLEGFEVERGIADLETAFVATFTQGSGPIVSFNSEFDALPGIGHACGHNLIAIGGVGAALALKEWLEEDSSRKGTVKLFGTPGEENGGGKINLIKAGYYKDVDINLMCHPTPVDGCYVPVLAIQAFEVEYFGKSAHAALAPWEGINALEALLQAFQNINALRQTLRPGMVIHGIILDGGKANNVIPDYAKGSFGVRAKTLKELEGLQERVRRCFEAAALSTGCRLAFTQLMQYKDMIINDPLAERYISYASKFGINFPSRADQDRVPGASTDEGDVSYEVPSLQAVYKIETKEPNHNPEFTKAAGTEDAHERTMVVSKSLALVGVDFFTQKEFRSEVKRRFKAGR